MSSIVSDEDQVHFVLVRYLILLLLTGRNGWSSVGLREIGLADLQLGLVARSRCWNYLCLVGTFYGYLLLVEVDDDGLIAAC